MDENDDELIHNYATFEEDEYSYYVLKIYGRTPSLPENTKISAEIPSIQVDIKDSDKPDQYEKMVVLSYGEFTRTYYIDYQFYPFREITSVSAGEDDNGNSIIDFWEHDYYYDEDDNEIHYLTIKGLTENLPEDIEITPYSPYLTTEIVKSDLAGYDTMAQLVAKDVSKVVRKYYITYTCIASDSESSSEATEVEEAIAEEE